MATKDQQSFEDREQGSTYEARKLECCRAQIGRLWELRHDDRLVRSRRKTYVSALRAFYRERQKVDGKLIGTVAKRFHTKKAAHQA